MPQTISIPYDLSKTIPRTGRDRLLRETYGVVLDNFTETMIIRLRPGQDLKTLLAEN